MKADTVLVDLNEIKVGFWDRLSNLSQDGETTIKDLLIELKKFKIIKR